MQQGTDFDRLRRTLAKQLTSHPDKLWTTKQAATFVGKAHSRIGQIYRETRRKKPHQRIGRLQTLPTGQDLIVLDGEAMARLVNYVEANGRNCG